MRGDTDVNIGVDIDIDLKNVGYPNVILDSSKIRDVNVFVKEVEHVEKDALKGK
jgi:hypothetical protein